MWRKTELRHRTRDSDARIFLGCGDLFLLFVFTPAMESSAWQLVPGTSLGPFVLGSAIGINCG
jgi:hypothetical protein